MTARVVSAAPAAAPDEAATNPASGVADASTKPTDAASLLNPANESKLHVLLVEDDHATLVFVSHDPTLGASSTWLLFARRTERADPRLPTCRVGRLERIPVATRIARPETSDQVGDGALLVEGVHVGG